MPARRSTRSQKKKEVEALSSGPGVHCDGPGVHCDGPGVHCDGPDVHCDGPDSVTSSQELDEPDGPAPVIAAKTTSLTTKKKSSKKTAHLPKQLKVSGDRKDGYRHKDSEQEDTIHVVEKKSVAGVGKTLPMERHPMEDQHNSEQNQKPNPRRERVVEQNQKPNPRRGSVVKVDKAGTYQKDGLPVRSKSKSREKESGQKETAPPGAVKPAPRANTDRTRDMSANSSSRNPKTDATGRDVKPKPAKDTAHRMVANSSSRNPKADTTGRDVKPKPEEDSTHRMVANSSSTSRNPKADTTGRDVKPKPAKYTTTHRMVDDSFTTTEDFSSSDSDFEEVSSQYRTQESYEPSSTCSDSGICRKLEDSFSDCRDSQGLSFSVSSGDVTDLSSPVCTMQKRDSHITERARDSGGTVNKGKAGGKVSSKAASGGTANKEKAGGKVSSKAAKVRTPGSSGSKMAAPGNRKVVQKKADKSERQHAKAKGKKKSVSAEHKASKSARTGTVKDMDQNSIMAILMKMEGEASKTDHSVPADQPSTSGQSKDRKVRPKNLKKKAAPRKTADADSTEESDWEEVEDHSLVKSQIPDGPVEITIDDPTMIHRKRKKKEFDWKAYVQRKIKRMAREIQIEMHKVNLLCLVSHGLQQSGVCSDVTVCAMALSLVPSSQLKKDVAFYDDHTLLFFLKWFRARFCLSSAGSAAEGACSLVTGSQLVGVIQDGTAGEARLLVMVLAAVLRAMGFNVRLVMSLQPLPLKASSAALGKAAIKRKTDDRSEVASSSSKKPKQVSGSQKTADTRNLSHKSTKSVGIKPKSTKSQSTKRASSDPKTAPSTSKTHQPTKSVDKSDDKSAVRKRKRATKSQKSSSSEEDDDDDDDEGPSVAKRRASERAGREGRPSTSAKDHDGGSEDGDDVSPSDGSNFSEEEEEAVMRRRRKSKAKGKGKGKKQSADVDEESDGEFDRSFQVKSLLVKGRKSSKKANRKVLSEDDEEEAIQSNGRDYWLEVYLPRQHKWLCVDCMGCKVGRPYDASAAASQPIRYVLGFENDGSVKDITAKYAPQWLSHTRKQRVDSDWWRESLEPFASQNTALDDLENRNIKDHLVERPLPTNIADFKNHPLYALRRHLLKFEAIYPQNSIPVGYIRKEPVYARECVHTLHSRDSWLKEARLVRLGETGYKVVKARKRWNRARDIIPEELDLELFGRWQTEDFIPLPAVDGKVPKNEYGNVEIFQPSMIPGGTVHIRVPALNRVARKLGIDIAAAMTGWDHHCGKSHPVLDGWIVCEEHEEVLLAAWEEDQEIQRHREEERREKRVLSNWKTLVRGLLIKVKLKKRFNLEEKPAAEVKEKKRGKGKKGEKATDVQHSWPVKLQQRRQKEEEMEKAAPPAPSHYTVETM